MTALVGPVRLFDVEPDPTAPYEVRDAHVRRVTTTGDLAAAVYATAATATRTKKHRLADRPRPLVRSRSPGNGNQ